jgi:hypothetical protein
MKKETTLKVIYSKEMDISTTTKIISGIHKAIQANSTIAKSRLTLFNEQCCVGYKEFFEAITSLLTIRENNENENIREFIRKTIYGELLEEVTLYDMMPSYRWNRICHNMKDILPPEDVILLMIEYQNQTKPSILN